MFGELLAPRYLQWLADGFLLTLGLSLLVCLVATVLGALLYLARSAPSRLLAWPARAYLLVIRNTPLLVQLFFWYFGVTALLPDSLVTWLNTPRSLALGPLAAEWPSFEFIAGFWGLTLYTTAFVAEELRAGIDSVRKEQRAAGLALGLRPAQVWLHVVLTLLLSLLSGVAAGVLGLMGGIALVISRGWLRWVLVGVLGFLRAIPVLMLMFWSYFLLPILFHVNVPALATVVCALSLIGGAYLSHSVAAGINSLPAGQWAAARALGLRPAQVLWLVILPQALPLMLPSFLNQWVSLIKDTSLAYVIGVGELSYEATQVSNRVMVHPVEIFLFVALVYFVLCSALQLAASRVARRGASAAP